MKSMGPTTRYALWERIFLAALSGACADPNIGSSKRAVEWSKATADLGLDLAEKQYTGMVITGDIP